MGHIGTLAGSRLRPVGWRRLALLLGALCSASLLLASPPRADAAGTPLIIDSDLFSNADDVAALATAFALQIKGEDQVIAITLNTRTDRPSVAVNTWKCAAAIAQFYNSASVPIGADMPDNGSQVGSPDFITPCAALASSSTPAPGNAVTVLRQALAGQPDGSVVIAEIGYEENLAALLNSPADGISALTGQQLVAQKVKELVVMGGGYPNYGGENNLAGNPFAAAQVAANWPTKVVWSGIEVGNALFGGHTVDSAQPLTSPVRAAMDAYAGPNPSFSLYDPTAVYHAVRPGDALLTEVGPGKNVVNSGSGANAFSLGSGNQFYLELTNAGSMDSTFESLFDVLPSGVSPPPPPPPVPSALTPPVIAGSTNQGQTLTESHGSWSNSPTGYSYQWEDCDSNGNNCSPVAGATGQSYLLTAIDAGSTIRVTETARNTTGLGSPAASVATAVIGPPPPVALSLPTIAGGASQGQVLTDVHGSWSNGPTGYSYQWEDCDSAGNGCVAIPGVAATGQTYLMAATDVGHTIRVAETARNAAGPGVPALSTPTPTISGSTPIVIVGPVALLIPTSSAPPTILRDRGAGPGARRVPRRLVEQPDRIHLPVGALQQHRRQLSRDQRRDRPHLHPGRRRCRRDDPDRRDCHQRRWNERPRDVERNRARARITCRGHPASAEHARRRRADQRATPQGTVPLHGDGPGDRVPLCAGSPPEPPGGENAVAQVLPLCVDEDVHGPETRDLRGLRARRRAWRRRRLPRPAHVQGRLTTADRRATTADHVGAPRRDRSLSALQAAPAATASEAESAEQQHRDDDEQDCQHGQRPRPG